MLGIEWYPKGGQKDMEEGEIVEGRILENQMLEYEGGQGDWVGSTFGNHPINGPHLMLS